ncbi:MAG: hypothetical protein ACYC0H_19475 [Solirubrobacteraceae bacterium]
MAGRQDLDASAVLARRMSRNERSPMRFVTFRRLEVASFLHSTGYVALLVFAFALGNLQPETFIFGWLHGGIWIIMSMLCIDGARRGVLPFWLAILVAVLGGLGPFAGTIGFVIADRRGGWARRPALAQTAVE